MGPTGERRFVAETAVGRERDGGGLCRSAIMKMVVASLTDGRTDREEKKRKGSLKLLQRGGKPPFAPPPLCSLFCPTDNFLPLLFPFSALAAVGERWRCGKIKIAAIWQRGLTCSLFVPNRLLRLRWNFFYDMALSTISSFSFSYRLCSRAQMECGKCD